MCLVCFRLWQKLIIKSTANKNCVLGGREICMALKFSIERFKEIPIIQNSGAHTRSQPILMEKCRWTLGKSVFLSEIDVDLGYARLWRSMKRNFGLCNSKMDSCKMIFFDFLPNPNKFRWFQAPQSNLFHHTCPTAACSVTTCPWKQICDIKSHFSNSS